MNMNVLELKCDPSYTNLIQRQADNLWIIVHNASSLRHLCHIYTCI